jgi:hypothetical protein
LRFLPSDLTKIAIVAIEQDAGRVHWTLPFFLMSRIELSRQDRFGITLLHRLDTRFNPPYHAFAKTTLSIPVSFVDNVNAE